MSVKISVVMASFLGEYDLSATDRVQKFHRAIHSFINQSYDNKELIVVADGCYNTAVEIEKYLHEHKNIKLVQIEKEPMFSGNVRNVGLFLATGDYVCYLDSDDFIGMGHLATLANYFEANPSIDWVYYDDYVIYRFNPITREVLNKDMRDVNLELGSIGTCSVAHRKLSSISWSGHDGYNHDWYFIKKNLIDANLRHAKIYGCEYNVCHVPNSVDC
jgi:glycosyltransferase involved in cell wall biosynthesis